MWRSRWIKRGVMAEHCQASGNAKLLAHLGNNLLRRIGGVRDDGICRLFESRELAGDQILLRKMPFSREHSSRKQLISAFQINEFHFGAGTQFLAITLFQR